MLRFYLRDLEYKLINPDDVWEIYIPYDKLWPMARETGKSIYIEGYSSTLQFRVIESKAKSVVHINNKFVYSCSGYMKYFSQEKHRRICIVYDKTNW